MNRVMTGVALAFATAAISGVSIFVNSYAVKQVADPAVFTTLKNAVAAVALLALALPLTRRSDLRSVDVRSWAGIAVVGTFGGGVAFLLFFTGLAMASAPSAAFIHKTLFVWVALLAVPLLRERLGLVQIAALSVLLLGQALVVPPTGVTWGTGETLIAAATLLWAAEVILARRLLARVPVAVLGVGRLGIGLVVLVGYLVLTNRAGLVLDLTSTQWIWVLGTGALLAGYVGTWFAALSRAPASVVTAVLVAGAPITAVLTGVANGTVPAPLQLVGYGLIPLAAAAVAIVAATGIRRAPTVARAG